jgi:hypothetical protein
MPDTLPFNPAYGAIAMDTSNVDRSELAAARP